MTLKERYELICAKRSNINEHLPILYKLAKDSNYCVEFGTGMGMSTAAILFANPRRLDSYDIVYRLQVVCLLQPWSGNTALTFFVADSARAKPVEADLLFIDSKHTYKHCRAELFRHGQTIRKWIILHDTVTFGTNGEGGERGILPAINEFLQANLQWHVESEYTNNNGLMILARKGAK